MEPAEPGKPYGPGLHGRFGWRASKWLREEELAEHAATYHVGRDLERLDFPLLSLDDRAERPELTSVGLMGREDVQTVGLEYAGGDVHPTIRFTVAPRRGWRLDGTTGHPYAYAPDLTDLAREAVVDAMLFLDPAPHADLDTRARVDRAGVAAAELAPRLAGEPWTVRVLRLDGGEYALWTTQPEPDRFCFFADCGSLLLTGSGLLPEPEALAFSTIQPADVPQSITVPGGSAS